MAILKKMAVAFVSQFSVRRDRKSIIKLICSLILLGIVTQIFESYVLTVILDMMPEAGEQYNEQVQSLISFTPQVIFLVCVFAPVSEEIVFRGLILKSFSSVFRFSIVNVVQALLFGLYHGNWVQGIYAFLTGLFIGYLLYVTGSCVYTMIFHLGVNLMGLFIGVLIPENTSFAIQTVLAAVSFVLIVGLLTAIKRVASKETVQQGDLI